ncbi:GTP-binding protein ERG [Gossypium australe]|uniref:GTP-binding protein ERG n=1 Tax=Gossypium australe TaxID=47621 RepID=A0A5B6V871_9ROSI|nr:GTP-binding protein ERG [Gossypium australe]
MNTTKMALTAVTQLTSLYPRRLHNFHHHRHYHHRLFYRLFSAQPQQRQDDSDDSHPNNSAISDFDSAQFSIPDTIRTTPQQPTWDVHHRQRVERIFSNSDLRHCKVKEEEEEEESRRRILAKALLEAALEGPDEDADQDQEVKEEDQKSLSVGIIGAPNAGKSALTNFMVGTKVAAVSRKTNTTTHEVLGVMTKGDTQICFFDTPGLMLNRSGYLHKDMKVRVESAWSSVNLYDVLMVIFDVHRHLTKLLDSKISSFHSSCPFAYYPALSREVADCMIYLPRGLQPRSIISLLLSVDYTTWFYLVMVYQTFFMREAALLSCNKLEIAGGSNLFLKGSRSLRPLEMQAVLILCYFVFFILIADQILILMIHPYRPDSRVIRLIKRMGEEPNPKQIRILCMNKVDLIEKKKELLKVAEQFKDLPGYGRIFMISGLKGSGVEDLTKYLMEQAFFYSTYASI